MYSGDGLQDILQGSTAFCKCSHFWLQKNDGKSHNAKLKGSEFLRFFLYAYTGMLQYQPLLRIKTDQKE